MNKHAIRAHFRNFIRESSNAFKRRCILQSPREELDVRNKSVEHKSKNKNVKNVKDALSKNWFPVRKVKLKATLYNP